MTKTRRALQPMIGALAFAVGLVAPPGGSAHPPDRHAELEKRSAASCDQSSRSHHQSAVSDQRLPISHEQSSVAPDDPSVPNDRSAVSQEQPSAAGDGSSVSREQGAVSHDQDLFFHLHQAIGHIEAVRTRRCPQAQPRAAQHLLRAAELLAESPASPLKGAFHEIDRMSKSLDHASAVEAERLRMELHDLGEALGLVHLASWNSEFTRCSR